MRVNGFEVGPGADLSLLDLQGVDFSGQLLSGAVFRGSDLTGARFRDCILHRADFSESNLVGADFTGAEFYDPDSQYDEHSFRSEVESWEDGEYLESFLTRLERAGMRDNDRPWGDEEFPDGKGESREMQVGEFVGKMFEVPARTGFLEHWSLDEWRDGVLSSRPAGMFEEPLTEAFWTLAASWRRSVSMVDRCAFFNDCSHDDTTVWPSRVHLADFPIFNQPTGVVWSNSGLVCPGSRAWGVRDDENDAGRWRGWSPPEGYPRTSA